MAKLKTDIQTAREKLNNFLRRDRRLDLVLIDERNLEDSVRSVEATIARHEKTRAAWKGRKDDLEASWDALSSQINQIKRGKPIDEKLLEEDRDRTKSLYQETHDRLLEVSSELKNLSDRQQKSKMASNGSGLAHLNLEIEGLRRQKADMEQRYATFREVNVRERAPIITEVRVDHIEQEINRLTLYSSKLRRQKKKLGQAIDYAITNLASMGIAAPQYRAKGKK
jgi:hypothetical protein